MIPANELRIGNYVSDIHASGNFFAKVIELKKNRCYYGLFHCGYNDLKPIPLTPEILEKCSFEYWTQDHICTDPADAYWVSKKIPFSISNLSWKIQKIGIKIKYLHQLQNLFYWLSGGEELNPQL